ncbi:Hpt domain-containing protein [Desulfolutivibrio sulfoxidireducens]|uniref:Hpt domain-containing protein n=1 Tax=Desulfolutivibrio sulfoxidireducens TaxID=2773299 RepID=UPI001FEB3852|nr:Hpt domain-containing protein [Desulfolutivibrio sulfoxidireducens]
MDDEIMALFVEDTREHLGDIESCLMDMERGGADIDEELVNKVFRAAHSIKGGAGFLNLQNTRDLGHKLENVLHMIRSREIAPDTRVVTILLHGFDRLRALVEHAATSDQEDISGLLADLSRLAVEHLPPEEKAALAETVDIALPDGRVLFSEDRLGLEQATKGGKLLYLVEYDLIHDVHARKKTPLDIFAAMDASGLIVDCRMDLAAVGDLDAPPANSIPLFVLFATIVEPDVVGYLFALEERRIRLLDTRALLARAASPPPGAGACPAGDAAVPGGRAWSARFGTLAVAAAAGETLARVAFDPMPGQAGDGNPGGADLAAALAACLERGLGARLEFPAQAAPGLSGLVALVSAARSFAARGLWLGHAGEVPGGLAEQARRAGFTPGALSEAGIGAGLLYGSRE